MATNSIKALLNKNGLHWNNGGSVGNRWDIGDAAGITFSFINGQPSYLRNHPQYRDFGSFTFAQKQQVRAAIDHYEEIANINIREVATGGTIEVGYAQLFYDFNGNGRMESNEGAAGLGSIPGLSRQASIAIDRDYSDFSKGSFGYHIIQHELGHAVGGFNDVTIARNPDNRYTARDAARHKGLDGAVIAAGEDSHKYTVMSYNAHPNMPGVFPRTLMLYDIAALQSVYGANMRTRAGNTRYTWKRNETFIETIWDAGGIDTFDASQQVRSTTLNLNAGAFSSVGSLHGRANAKDNLAIAFNTTIENAIGGTGNDVIIGNQVNNHLYGNAGNDHLHGGTGNDRLYGGTGNDVLTGVNQNNFNAGKGELDVLTGGGGADRFVLGDKYEAFYSGNGYALITDFNRFAGDSLTLHGDVSEYSLGYSNVAGGSARDTLIYHQNDLIAIAQDTTSLNLNSNAVMV
ncbi:M10 family metallopeptidase [Adonisia turfae]|uniref:Peptidase metallopeptidase domain-containing protein n=1 Tax=Adonisia turfae CCMR0081 TaxID=2292702 RepID=A0A6M0RRQ4_9CYAN|nr:M10 family metallopeptidase C-terminal domain-containing protein [Adonisia turfae]NEZ58452.1 hypothetical protein [Adonisia turfae CCMR0081]